MNSITEFLISASAAWACVALFIFLWLRELILLRRYQRNIRNVPEFRRIARQLFLTRVALEYFAAMRSEHDNDHYVLVYRDTLRERIQLINQALNGQHYHWNDGDEHGWRSCEEEPGDNN